MAEENTGKWAEVKKDLKKLDQKELIDMLLDLYRHSAENRRIISGKGEKENWVLETYRNIIRNEFFSFDDFGGLRSDVAMKAIRDYSEGAGDLEGTMDLMLTYVENVVEFVNEYGDIDEEFYEDGCDVFEEFCKLLKTEEGQKLGHLFKERVMKIHRDTEDFGYGFGDDIDYYFSEIKAFFEDE